MQAAEYSSLADSPSQRYKSLARGYRPRECHRDYISQLAYLCLMEVLDETAGEKVAWGPLLPLLLQWPLLGKAAGKSFHTWMDGQINDVYDVFFITEDKYVFLKL